MKANYKELDLNYKAKLNLLIHNYKNINHKKFNWIFKYYKKTYNLVN